MEGMRGGQGAAGRMALAVALAAAVLASAATDPPPDSASAETSFARFGRLGEGLPAVREAVLQRGPPLTVVYVPSGLQLLDKQGKPGGSLILFDLGKDKILVQGTLSLALTAKELKTLRRQALDLLQAKPVEGDEEKLVRLAPQRIDEFAVSLWAYSESDRSKAGEAKPVFERKIAGGDPLRVPFTCTVPRPTPGKKLVWEAEVTIRWTEQIGPVQVSVARDEEALERFLKEIAAAPEASDQADRAHVLLMERDWKELIRALDDAAAKSQGNVSRPTWRRIVGQWRHEKKIHLAGEPLDGENARSLADLDHFTRWLAAGTRADPSAYISTPARVEKGGLSVLLDKRLERVETLRLRHAASWRIKL